MTWTIRWSLILFLVTGIVVVFLFNPESTLYPPCFFKKLTNLQCPGCGSARACYHLLHGNFVKAIDYNLLLATFLPFIMIDGFSRLFNLSAAEFPKLQTLRSRVKPVYVLVIVLVFWILRNLPFHPFIFLSSDY